MPLLKNVTISESISTKIVLSTPAKIQRIFLSPEVKRSVIISKKLVYRSCLTICQTTSDLGS